MRMMITCMAGVALLLGCTPRNPNDGAQYFDTINPNPTVLEEEQQQLRSVENPPENIQPPEYEPPPDEPVSAAQAEPVETTATTDEQTATAENSTISDSQDFARVQERETIESDSAKLAALKDTYQIVEPTAVPTRKNSVNLAAYALQQDNPVGQRVYRRIAIGIASCGRYRRNPDDAQRAFLLAGGPEKDKLNLDPDGDGYACKWDPEVYRRLLPQG